MNKFDRLGPPKWQLQEMTISPLRRAPKLRLVSETGQVDRTQTGDRVAPKLDVAETDVERTRRQWEENERGKNDYVDQVNHDLRQVVVNVMRTMRGAGKPYEIFDQVVSLADTMLRCHQYFGYPHDYDAFRRSTQLCYFGDEDCESDKAWWAWQRAVVSGSLRLLAARMAGNNYQSSQLSAGEYDMLDGMRTWQKFEEEEARYLATKGARRLLDESRQKRRRK
jgi:hypothetical protein